MEHFGLSGSSALVLEESERTSGLPWAEVLERAEAADLLVNISGHLDIDSLMSRLRRKAYVDIDPGFTQFWHAAGVPGTRLAGHDVYFTVGENIGTAGVPRPDRRHRLAARTRQPVVLDDWPLAEARERDRFTTVASWRAAFGPVEFDGRTYGLKVHEFRKVLALPQRAPGTFEIALDIHPGEPRDLRRAAGQRLADRRPRRGRRRPRCVPRLRAGVRRRVLGRPGRLRRHLQRLVQRPHRPLPRLRQARARAGHRLRPPPTRSARGWSPSARSRRRSPAPSGSAPTTHGTAEAARALAERHFDSDKVLADFLSRAGVS